MSTSRYGLFAANTQEKSYVFEQGPRIRKIEETRCITAISYHLLISGAHPAPLDHSESMSMYS
jgi:hypothetical protein